VKSKVNRELVTELARCERELTSMARRNSELRLKVEEQQRVTDELRSRPELKDIELRLSAIEYFLIEKGIMPHATGGKP
jgi:hypothetical protein